MCADDYLTKPFDSSELIARIRAHLEQKRHISAKIYKAFIKNHPQMLDNGSVEGNTKKLSNPFEQKFKRIVIENIENVELDINLLADFMNMDRSTLFRKVKKTFSCTPNNYIKFQRLQLSLKLLQQQSGTISEIAYAVGFNSLNYFSRSFKEYFKVPPSEHQQI